MKHAIAVLKENLEWQHKKLKGKFMDSESPVVYRIREKIKELEAAIVILSEKK